MKIRYILLFAFSLLFAGNGWAQLTCTNCQVGTNAPVTGTTAFTILAAPGTSSAAIVLSATDPSIFTISGAGEYTLSGVISGGLASATAVSLRYITGSGTLILAGSMSNTYSGTTELFSGQLVLNRLTGVVSVPGNFLMTGSTYNNVWCMNGYQFKTGEAGDPEYKISFLGATLHQRFNLFGTTQKIGGIESNNSNAIIQYGELSTGGQVPASPSMVTAAWPRNSAAFLELCGSNNYNFMGAPFFRSLASSNVQLIVQKDGTGTQTMESPMVSYSGSGKVIFNILGGTLVWQNPNTNTSNVTFNSAAGGTIELKGTGGTSTSPVSYDFGAGCLFTGSGAYKKTGAFSTISLQPSGGANPGNVLSMYGTLTIEGGTLKNIYNNINWTDSEADVTLNSGTTFDLWGNQTATIFDQLSGAGTIRNNWGGVSPPYASNLWIGVRNGNSTFDGIIVNNTVNNNVPGGTTFGGRINLTKKGTGRQILTGTNTFDGTTMISGGLLGGPGSIASSAVTVATGCGIFGGTGTGNNGIFTTGNLTFTGTSANPAHVEVYADNSNALTPLSLIQVGGTLPRTGTGTLTAAAGTKVNIDFMDEITVADGTYTIISSADASTLAGTFQVGINNSGCCLSILKNGLGIQVSIIRINLTPTAISMCPSVMGISKTASINAACSVITTAKPGVWSVVNQVNNAGGEATNGTATVLGGTVTAGNNPATITSGEPGSVNLVFTIPLSSNAGCTGSAIRRVDIATKPTVSGRASACSGVTIPLTGGVSSGATLTGAHWYMYSTNTASGANTSTPAAHVLEGNPVSSGTATPLGTGISYIRFFDSNQCYSEPFTFTTLQAPVLELLSGGIEGGNITCPTGTTAGNTQPVILARYTSGKPTSTTNISWTFSSTEAGWQEPSGATSATHADGVTGTYAIQRNTAVSGSAAYSVRYVDASTCISTLNLTVTRQPLLANNAGTAAATTICLNGTAAFSLTNADAGWTWQSGDPAIAVTGQEGVASGTISSVTVSGIKIGSTVIYTTDTHGCNSEKLAVTVKALPVIESPSPVICFTIGGVAGTMNLVSQENPSATMENPWAFNPGSSAAFLTNLATDKKTILFNVFSTAITAPVPVTVQYTDVNGCIGTKVITINPNPVIDTGSPFTVCATVGSTAGVLNIGSSSAPGAADNPWSFNPASTDADLSTPSSDKKSITITVRNQNQTTIKTATVQYTDVNGCTGTQAITIIPNPVLAAAAGTTLSSLCSGVSYPYAITVSGPGTTGTGTWGITNNSIKTQLTGDTPLTAVSVAAGSTQAVVTHLFTYTSGDGCASNGLSVTVNPGSTVSLPANATNKLCHAGSTLQLSASGATSYTWSSDNETVATVNAQGLVTSVAFGNAIISAGATGSTGCAGTQAVEVDDPQVSAATGVDVTKLCAGNDYTDALTLTNGSTQGAWQVYDAPGITTPTATNTTAAWGTATTNEIKNGSIHAGNISGTVTQYVAFTQSNCMSSPRLMITISAPPVMSSVIPRVLCTGAASGAIPLTSGATGNQAANLFKWSGGSDVGLMDQTTTWTASPIPSFTAVNGTEARVTQNITVLPSNSNSLCVGAPVTLVVVVNPAPVVTAAPLTPMCSGSVTSFGLHGNIPGMLYTWTVTHDNGVGATNDASVKNDIQQTLTNTGDGDVTVTYTITPQTAQGCLGTAIASNVVVKNIAAVSATGTTGGGSFCLLPVASTSGNPRSQEGGTFTTNIQPRTTPEDATAQWVYTSSHSSNVSGVTSSNTPQTLSVIADNLIVTGSDTETITYSIRPYSSGCAGTASDIVVVLNPTPEFTGDVNSVPDITLCGGVVHPDIEVVQTVSSGASKPTGFTWVAATGSDDVGLADYTDNANPRTNIGPFTALSVTANRQRSITITPRNTTTGCTGLEQVVVVFLKVSPFFTNSDPETCSTNPNALVLSTLNAGGAGNSATNPWTVVSGNAFGSVAAHTGEAASADFIPVNNTQTGTQTVDVQYTDANGCTAVAHVAVNYPPEMTFAPATHPAICAGNTDVTEASVNIGISSTQPNTKYTWSSAKGEERATGSNVWVNNAAVPTDAIIPVSEPLVTKIQASAGADVDIIFSVTPRTGSCSGTMKTLTMKVLSGGFVSSVTPASKTICSGVSPGLTVGEANDGSTYTWTIDGGSGVTGAVAQTIAVPGGTLINSVLSIPADRPNKKSVRIAYYVTATRGACQGVTATVNVDVEPIPTITGLTSGSICNNSLTGIVLANDIDPSEAGRVKYTWTVDTNSVGATAGTVAQSAFTDQTLINNDAGGTDASVTYTFTAAYGDCVGLAAQVVRTVTAPIVLNTISGGGKFCLGDLATLTSNAKGGALTYKWWKNNEATPIEGAVASTYAASSNAESTDSYSVSVSNACQSDLVAVQPVSVQVTKDAYFEGATAMATYPAGGATLNKDWVKFTYTPLNVRDAANTIYAWDFGDGTFIATSQNPSHLYTTSTTGSVTPILIVKKAGQNACTKTLSLSPIVLLGLSTEPTTGDLSRAGFSVFPIPTHDQITITGESDMTQITLSDLNGKKVSGTPVSGNQVSVPVSGLSSGLYVLTVETAHGVKHVKIIKE